MVYFVTKKLVHFDDGVSVGKTIIDAERVPRGASLIAVCPVTGMLIEATEWLATLPGGRLIPLSNKLLRKVFEKPKDEKGMVYAMPPAAQKIATEHGGRVITRPPDAAKKQ